MGCCPSTSSNMMISPAHGLNGRINVRFLMNPADSNDKRQPQQMHQSFSHVRQMPIGTLEQACQTLQIKNLSSYVAKAKRFSQFPKEGLKQDEQAAINLYTQQNQFYKELNDALRKNDKRTLMPWCAYLKLFLAALDKLPPYQGTVWRGVAKDLSAKYNKNDEHVWWAFSSCTSSVAILKSPNFLGDSSARTLFNIEVLNGRLINKFSEYADEHEILLLPGTRLRVVSVLKQPAGLTIVHLKEIEPTYSLFESSELYVESYQPVSHHRQQNDFNDETYSQSYPPVDEYYEPPTTVTADAMSAFDTQIQLAKGISDDSDKAKVLKRLLANKNLTDKMIASLVDCAKTMYNSDDKAEVFQLIARRSNLSTQQFRVSVAAASSISDGDDTANTLKAFLVHEQYTVQHLDVVLSSTARIYGSDSKASVFLQLINNRYLNAQHFPSILDGIKGISDDDDKSKVLCKLAPRLPKSDANVRKAYLAAAGSIYGSEEKAAVTMAFTSDSGPKGSQQQKGFSGNASNSMSAQNASSAFDTQIQLAKGISDDSDKAKVLKNLLNNKNLTDQMIASLVDCAKTMYSSDDKAEVFQLIARRSNLSTQQFRVSVAAASGISDSDDMANTLKAFLVHEQYTVQHLDVVLSSTARIYGSDSKASVFLQLINNRYLNAQHFPLILDGIKGISDSDDKSKVLCKLAPRLPKSDANVRKAYLAAAGSIYGSEEKAAATMAFM